MESEFISIRDNVVEIIKNPTGRKAHKEMRQSNYNRVRFVVPVIGYRDGNEFWKEVQNSLWISDASSILHKEMVETVDPKMMEDFGYEDNEEVEFEGEDRRASTHKIAGWVEYSVSEEVYMVTYNSFLHGEEAAKLLQNSKQFQKSFVNRPIIYDQHRFMLSADGKSVEIFEPCKDWHNEEVESNL